MRVWFPAKYRGKCVHCAGAFLPGESIRKAEEGGYECANCDPDVQTAVVLLDTVRPTSICDKCFCPPPCNCS